MKKYIFLLIIFSGILGSCSNDIDDVFGKSQDERIQEAMEYYGKVLVDNPKGWVMEYYPEATRKYGGYNLFFKFEDGLKSTIGSDLIKDAGTETSYYSILSDMGPTLNFDSYNSILHYFSDPSLDVGGGYGFGFEGDYEFMIIEGTEEGVTLQGKKTKNELRLMPLPTESWEDYVESIYEMQDKTTGISYRMKVDGYNYSIKRERKVNTFTIINLSNKGEELEVKAPFIYTHTGIKFYEPVVVNNKALQNFTYNPDSKLLVSDDADASIETRLLPLNEIFAETKEHWMLTSLSQDFSDIIEDVIDILYKEEQQVISSLVFGESTFDKEPGSAISVISDDGSRYYHTIYYADFTPVNGTEDQIEFREKSKGNLTSTYDKYYVDFMPLFWEKSPYKMIADDPRCPYQITFVSIADESFFFTVEY